tara:strand:+ start:422 stop:1525 length:1104 start_codon:yes stop_codon:yes gene_type:complete
MSILDSGVKFVKNPDQYVIGEGTVAELISVFANNNIKNPIVFVDKYFECLKLEWIPEHAKIIYVDCLNEPTTDGIDCIMQKLRPLHISKTFDAVVSVGGGSTMDTGKAVSNLLTNKGLASEYQGWDLVKEPGVYKIAIPSISGTGAESTRTCVMTNKETNLKLGMNSDYSVYNFIIMDPLLMKTVPKEQLFFTAMDAYIHCVESLSGRYRNPIGDAYSDITLKLCESIFRSGDLYSRESRENLMVASYLGGLSIATSYVGLIHPFSAGLSVVYGTKHCLGNCIALTGLQKYYPNAYNNMLEWLILNDIKLPKFSEKLDHNELNQLFKGTIIHNKPLYNALGEKYQSILNLDEVSKCFVEMKNFMNNQ